MNPSMLSYHNYYNYDYIDNNIPLSISILFVDRYKITILNHAEIRTLYDIPLSAQKVFMRIDVIADDAFPGYNVWPQTEEQRCILGALYLESITKSEYIVDVSDRLSKQEKENILRSIRVHNNEFFNVLDHAFIPTYYTLNRDIDEMKKLIAVRNQMMKIVDGYILRGEFLADYEYIEALVTVFKTTFNGLKRLLDEKCL